MKRGETSIPKTKLGQNLDEAAAVKIQMTELLRELEEKATGGPIKKPGLWRQDPLGWLKKNKF